MSPILPSLPFVLRLSLVVCLDLDLKLTRCRVMHACGTVSVPDALRQNDILSLFSRNRLLVILRQFCGKLFMSGDHH